MGLVIILRINVPADCERARRLLPSRKSENYAQVAAMNFARTLVSESIIGYITTRSLFCNLPISVINYLYDVANIISAITESFRLFFLCFYDYSSTVISSRNV